MFIDTSGWLCLFDETDWRHKDALVLYESSRSRVTHSYILAELVALALSRKHRLVKILAFVQDILRDSEIQMIWTDEALTWRAIGFLETRLDKAWSLCDAVSFVVMADEGILEALSTDHNFEQAGLVKLLES